MLKRKITQSLLDWWNGDRGKALLIKGLRQVGKTYIIEDFCRKHYSNYIYINFKTNENIKEAFKGNLEVDELIVALSAYLPGKQFIPGKTIIFYDEIQECARARASIKPFVIDGRYNVIASGSLLGLRNYNPRIKQNVPAGYEHIIKMHGLDFEEFLWARGIDDSVISLIKKCFEEKKPVPQSIHLAMLRYYKEYIIVGGMPSVVNTFISSNDVNQVLVEQRDLVEEFKDDFGTHLDESENEQVDKALLNRIEAVFNSVPSQLAKENKKFFYSNISSKAKGREYSSSIQWLIDYGLFEKSYNLNSLEPPLEGNKDLDSFKLFFTDSGLLISMLEGGTAADILSGNLYIYKGAIFENALADALIKNSYPLYYFRKNSGLEVDFVERLKGEVVLVECKATTGNTKSYSTILKNKNKYHVSSCIKIGEYNIGETEGLLTLPYYLSFLI